MRKKTKEAHEQTKSLINSIESMLKVRLLICDDDIDILQFMQIHLKKGLKKVGVDIDIAVSNNEISFIEDVKRNNLCALIIDIYLGEKTGIDIAEKLDNEGLINVPIIFVSGEYPSDENMARIRALGGIFFHKPITETEWDLIIEHIRDGMK